MRGLAEGRNGALRPAGGRRGAAAGRTSVGAASLLLGVGSKPWSRRGPGPPSRPVRPGAAALRRQSAPVAGPSFPGAPSAPFQPLGQICRGSGSSSAGPRGNTDLEAFLCCWLYDTDLPGKGLSPRFHLFTNCKGTGPVFFDPGKIRSSSHACSILQSNLCAWRGPVAASQINPGVPGAFHSGPVSVLSHLNVAGSLYVVFQEYSPLGGNSAVWPFHVTLLIWTGVSSALTICFLHALILILPCASVFCCK